MTNPTLDWLRSEMQDARERCEALEGVDAHEWADYAARRSHEDRRAALSVLDRIGTELARADMDTLFDALDRLEEAAGPEVVEVLGELRDAALRREADDGAS